ncbi:hypothetical protein BD779DRAFT_1476778 [Infundibulicybe gibba]|nr:hypothetical protein BD779DRAFT_1476778 [Infundibulicybe gibba]
MRSALRHLWSILGDGSAFNARHVHVHSNSRLATRKRSNLHMKPVLSPRVWKAVLVLRLDQGDVSLCRFSISYYAAMRSALYRMEYLWGQVRVQNLAGNGFPLAIHGKPPVEYSTWHEVSPQPPPWTQKFVGRIAEQNDSTTFLRSTIPLTLWARNRCVPKRTCGGVWAMAFGRKIGVDAYHGLDLYYGDGRQMVESPSDTIALLTPWPATLLSTVYQGASYRGALRFLRFSVIPSPSRFSAGDPADFPPPYSEAVRGGIKGPTNPWEEERTAPQYSGTSPN